MVIDTKLEAKEDVQNNHEVSPVTKVISESESLKKGAKVPPPVARKPKTMGKEVEMSEGAEQTAGQEARQESIKGKRYITIYYQTVVTQVYLVTRSSNSRRGIGFVLKVNLSTLM